VKVDGKRSYARVRAGEDVQLHPRTVTIAELVVDDVRRPTVDVLDVDVHVTCSSGTYIRALARDLGGGLGVGGHLTSLRRTRIGDFDVTAARTVEQLEKTFEVMPFADAVRSIFPMRSVSDDEATDVRHGRPIGLRGESELVGVFDADGRVLALMEPRGDALRVVAGFVGSP
jgi:tRNA pseudouridine55 synthase